MKNSKGMIILLAGLASLTLIIAVAYFFFSRDSGTPKLISAPAVATPVTPLPDSFDPVEWSRKPQSETTSLDKPAAAADTPDGGFVVTMPPDKTGKTGITETSTNPKPTVNFPSENPTATGKVDFPENSAKTPAQKVQPVVVATAAPKKPSGAEKPTSAVTPAKVVAAPKKVTVTEYWIQVGAFKDRFQADSVSKSLENEGLKGTMSTITLAGSNIVRVRVGPYTNQEEAQKFLAWVKPVKGLEESYITSTKATR